MQTAAFCYILLAFSTILHGFPIDTLNNKVAPAKVLDFMKQFGYLEEEDEQSSALYTEDGISQTIKTMQLYGALPQTGILDNATLQLLSAPRCGVKDVIKKRSRRYAFGSDGWKKRTITYFIANWSGKLSEAIVAKNVHLALDTWGKYGRLRFSRVSTPDADIIVAFGRGYHGDRFAFDGPGNILAHAFFPNSIRDIGGDIHFDDDENWTSSGSSGTDFLTVALHELGHSLGLAHSSDANAVMFPYYKGFEPGQQLQLGYDDILGMYELYIRGYSGEPEIEDEEDATTSTTSRTTFSTTLDLTTTDLAPSTTSRTDVIYSGDSETVDEHEKHEKNSKNSTFPHICEGYFDAVATLREELFIFKAEYVWRLKDMGQVYAGYPVTIHQMFPQLPQAIRRIDAAYQRPDGSIILFTNNRFWVFDGREFVESSPRPISDYGLPTPLDKIDAVQIWGKNEKTYFYARDRFWRYNETAKAMDAGYPRHMEKWRNIPTHLDAATTWKGVTYFFKAASYWKFDNNWVIATDESPMPAPQLWLGCPEDMMMMLGF